MKIVNSPCCAICLKNYSCLIVPKILSPCGHGICSECLHTFKEHEEEKNGSLEDLKCPQCRGIIIGDFENYDLQHITNNVDLNHMPYWSKRLLEAIDNRGAIVEVDEKLMPFCRTLFTRIVYNEDIKVLGLVKSENWTDCDRQKIRSISGAFTTALTVSQIDVDEALDWITVLNVPQCVEVKLLHDVNRYYTTRNFLKTRNAEWLMDTLFE